MEKQPILQEAYKEEEVLVADAEKTSGANPLFSQGSTAPAGAGTGSRTATGASLVGAASSGRVQSFIDVVCEQVLLPVCYSFLKMDRMWLDLEIARKIVGKSIWEAMEADYDGDLHVDMCNNDDIEFTLLAGSNIAAKQKMASTLPLLGQQFEAPAVQQGLAGQGKKFNWLEYCRRWEKATGWNSPEDLIIDMTDQDKQQAMATNPKVLDAQATRARLQQMHGNKLAEADQANQHKIQQIQEKGITDAGQVIATKSVERASEHIETPQIQQGLEDLGTV